MMKRTLLVAIAIGAGAATFVSAQSAARRPLAIEDYYRVQTVGGMRWSPDGKTVTFSVTTRIEEGNATRTETFTVPADGSAPPVKVEPPAGGDLALPGRQVVDGVEDPLPNGQRPHARCTGHHQGAGSGDVRGGHRRAAERVEAGGQAALGHERGG